MKKIFHAQMLLFALTLAGSLATVSAQSYSIAWSKIAGGGGTSGAGQYSLSGTSGQHDAAGPMTNGQYSVTGGFWALAVAVQTPGAPLLSIELLPGGVRVFWPVTSTGFVLEAASALTTSPLATVWSRLPPAIYQTNATQISVTVSPALGNTFYRLQKP